MPLLLAACATVLPAELRRVAGTEFLQIVGTWTAVIDSPTSRGLTDAVIRADGTFTNPVGRTPAGFAGTMRLDNGDVLFETTVSRGRLTLYESPTEWILQGAGTRIKLDDVEVAGR